MALFSKGLALTQHKEPALSSKLTPYSNSQPVYLEGVEEFPMDMEQLTTHQLLQIAKAAQIHDERDGRLLVSKLRKAEPRAKAIVVDAIDDEPYLSNRISPMLQLSEDLILGIELCQRIIPTDDVKIQVYKHMSEVHTNIPSKIGGYTVERLRGGYPALPSSAQQRSTNQGETLEVSVGALIHFARAVRDRVPQTTTFLTVAGNCVANPMNLEVSLGMNLTEILERCGLIEDPTRVVIGGPMTGVAVIDTDATQVTYTTQAILATKEQSHERAYACIGCGRCEQYCPVGLNPMYIGKFMAQKYYPQLEQFDAHHCISCGTCSYVCPSRLDVLGEMLKARRYAIDHFVIPAKEAAAQEEEDSDDL